MSTQSADGQFLYLSRADVMAAGLDVSAMIGLLETAFREKGDGRVEMPPKPGIHTQPDAFLHAMPAYIPAMKAAGIKWVGGYPLNHARGLPYITGLLVLNDVETGVPYAVMDCAWITAYRTAAASALSARYLARPGSSTVGILACGVQGRSHLEALAAVFPVGRVFAYDTRRDVQDGFVADMRARFGFDVVGVDHPKAAVVDSDLVVTSGPILKQPVPDHPGGVAASRRVRQRGGLRQLLDRRRARRVRQGDDRRPRAVPVLQGHRLLPADAGPVLGSRRDRGRTQARA